MRVGWLCDAPDYIGGAELTQAEFRAAAPEGVEIVDCPPDDPVLEADVAVVFNCVSYGPPTQNALAGKRIIRYWNDLAPHGDEQLQQTLLQRSDTHIFCSPLHRDRFPHPWQGKSELIPPAVDLARFRPTRQVRRNGKREGAVAIGAYMNPGKGAQLIAEYAQRDGGVDYWGFGPCAPPETAQVRHLGQVGQAELPSVLWRYERFVHLPTEVEPFGRAVVEAWAAGLTLIVNRNVGALYWLEEKPEALETAAEDFWQVVLS